MLQALNPGLGALGTVRYKFFNLTVDGQPPDRFPMKDLAPLDTLTAVMEKLQYATLKRGRDCDANALQKQALDNTDVFLMLPILLNVERHKGMFRPSLSAILKQEVAVAVTGSALVELVESR